MYFQDRPDTAFNCSPLLAQRFGEGAGGRGFKSYLLIFCKYHLTNVKQMVKFALLQLSQMATICNFK